MMAAAKETHDEQLRDLWSSVNAKLQARVFWTVISLLVVFLGYVSLQYISNLKEIHRVEGAFIQKAGEMHIDIGIIKNKVEQKGLKND